MFALSALACAATSPSDEPVATSTAALRPTGDPPIIPPIPTSPTKPKPPPSTPPATEPIGFEVRSTTNNSAYLTWQESGQNTFTSLYRQAFDMSGNPLGSAVLVYVWSGLSGQVAVEELGGTYGEDAAPPGLLADSMYTYQIEEQSGDDCTTTSAGSTCVWSLAETAHTRDNYEYPLSRIQLTLQVDSASTAAAPGDHINVSLGGTNSTWIGSSSGLDFTSSSRVVYDLTTSGLGAGDRSDIANITITTTDDDGLCIDAVALTVNDTVTFSETFPTCQWVYDSAASDGNSLVVSWLQLRANSAWMTYAPTDLSPKAPSPPNTIPTLQPNGTYSNGDPNPIWFAGFDQAGLIGYLDAMTSNNLRNPYNAYGWGAALSAPTTISRIDDDHLSISQHVTGLSVNGISASADPIFELILQDGDGGWTAYSDVIETNVQQGIVGTVLSDLTGVIAFIVEQDLDSLGYAIIPDIRSICSTIPTQVGLLPAVPCFAAPLGVEGDPESPLLPGSYAGGITACNVGVIEETSQALRN
jgi:hypothetical protein